MDIKIGKICNIGGRQKNDDTAEIALGNNAVRAYIGDGLGSYAGGKQASETAGQALLTFPGSMLGDEELRTAAQQANQAVYALQSRTQGNMKTTIVFLSVEDDKARWMHVGDSRLYHFVDGKLVFQTTDHSVSQMAVMMGEINTHQIRFHEDRNRVLRSLGGENAKPELSELTDISKGSHAFLLCTDGFWEYVYEAEMEDTLAQAKNPDDWIARMEKILLSRVNGSNDNYSASVVFINVPEAGALPRMRKSAGKRSGKGLLTALILVLLASGVGVSALLLPGLRKKEPARENPAVTAQTEEATTVHIVTPDEFEALMPKSSETESVATEPAETEPAETEPAEAEPQTQSQEPSKVEPEVSGETDEKSDDDEDAKNAKPKS